jgi:RNA methyltransferase, TrmH family
MDVPLKPYKKEFAHSYAFGVFPTLELVQQRPEATLKVLASEAGLKNRGVAKLSDLCEQRHIPFEVNTRAVERLTPKENAYVVGVFGKYEGKLDAGGDHVLLVNPSDMGNLGTITRTMLGFGVTNLGIVRPAADIFDPRAVRASMGALFNLNCQYFDDYEAYSATYANRALYPFMTGGAQPLPGTRFEHPYTLIFGNESAGLSALYREIGKSITIPHSHRIDSLSLPIAVGVALYEATKT